uniref:Uncharacterized protein n=1 Tax=Glossina palpalis gambiensis TaxID=67801 RepID=A0A1B0C6R7_9MUSC
MYPGKLTTLTYNEDIVKHMCDDCELEPSEIMENYKFHLRSQEEAFRQLPSKSICLSINMCLDSRKKFERKEHFARATRISKIWDRNVKLCFAHRHQSRRFGRQGHVLAYRASHKYYFALVCLNRYSDYVSSYNSMMKVIVLAPSGATVYLILTQLTMVIMIHFVLNVVILPQLFKGSKTGEDESIDAHYLFALGSYQRIPYCDLSYLYNIEMLKGERLP